MAALSTPTVESTKSFVSTTVAWAGTCTDAAASPAIDPIGDLDMEPQRDSVDEAEPENRLLCAAPRTGPAGPLLRPT
jgi:hypothetical protein